MATGGAVGPIAGARLSPLLPQATFRMMRLTGLWFELGAGCPNLAVRCYLFGEFYLRWFYGGTVYLCTDYVFWRGVTGPVVVGRGVERRGEEMTW